MVGDVLVQPNVVTKEDRGQRSRGSPRLLCLDERPAEEPPFFFFFFPFPPSVIGTTVIGGMISIGGDGLSPTPDAPVGASFSRVGTVEGPIWPLDQAVALSDESSGLSRVLAHAMNSTLEIVVRP